MFDRIMSSLPPVNAALNAAALVLLAVGYRLIKQKRIDAHKRVMIAAFAVSGVFLVLYVAHKVWKHGVNTPYHGAQPVRGAYYAMLFSHILLAMTVPVYAIALIRLGLARRDAAHKKLARVALPIWIYVSVTGVLIYVMLYHLNPGG